jgi:hypothetical protein
LQVAAAERDRQDFVKLFERRRLRNILKGTQHGQRGAMSDKTIRLVYNHWNLFAGIVKLGQQVFSGRAQERQVDEDRLHRVLTQNLESGRKAVREKQLKFIAAVRFQKSI